MNGHFADCLSAAIRKKNSVAVVGIDPQFDLFPIELQEIVDDCGERQQALELFGKGVIDAVGDLVPAVKPNIAFFEAFGLAGLAAYVTICAYAYNRGLIVIGDVKRGDIASTAAAYAAGLLRPLPADGARADNPFQLGPHHAITLNPYLGSDNIQPFLVASDENGQGIFCLVKTSNPSSREIQDLKVVSDSGEAGGEITVAERVAMLVDDWGKSRIGSTGFSNVGAVVGATHAERLSRFRELMPHAFFLLPGYGAQGATAENLASAFRQDGLGAIVNASRSIIYAWRKGEFAVAARGDWRGAARNATLKMNADLNSALTTAGKNIR